MARLSLTLSSLHFVWPFVARWRRPSWDWRAELLPWGVSLVLHAGLLAAAAVMVRSVSAPRPAEEIVAYVRLAPPEARAKPAPPKPQPAPPAAPVPVAVPEPPPAVATPAPAPAPPVTPAPVASAAPKAVAPAPSPSATPSSEGRGGAGLRDGYGATSTAHASESVAPLPAPLPPGPKAEFYGLGGNARRIVYVVDASGSLIDTMPYVLAELQRSIAQLVEPQQFTVLFFQGGHVLEIQPPGLKAATAYRKQQAIDWMAPSAGNVRPAGTSSPLSALQRALDYQPDLIFLLSDNIAGHGGGRVQPQVLLDHVARINTTGTKINTIQFLYPEESALLGGPSTLQRLAQMTGGVYRFVSAREAGAH